MAEKKNNQKNKHQSGQSMIEMALLLPIMLVLIVMALEFGRMFFTKIVLTNAAREAAYYLSLNPSDSTNATLAAQTEASNSGVPDISVSISPQSTYGGEQSIEVTVSTDLRDFHMLNLINNTFAITGTRHDFFSISSSVEMMVQ